jgi:superfamily I DNA and/or RNA helicase
MRNKLFNVINDVSILLAVWKRTGQRLNIGVVSPYSSQVDAIKSRLGKKYETYDGFQVRVKSVDGFQGEEDDFIVLSTVRSNRRAVVRFVAATFSDSRANGET